MEVLLSLMGGPVHAPPQQQQSRHYFWLDTSGQWDILVRRCVFSIGGLIPVVKHIGWSAA